MADHRDAKAPKDPSEPYDPGPDTIDPAPWLGQVGEGATLPSGEAIARGTSCLTANDLLQSGKRPSDKEDLSQGSE